MSRKRLLDLSNEQDRQLAFQWLEESDDEDVISETSEIEDILEIDSADQETGEEVRL